jgi:hypothetical protein
MGQTEVAYAPGRPAKTIDARNLMRDVVPFLTSRVVSLPVQPRLTSIIGEAEAAGRQPLNPASPIRGSAAADRVPARACGFLRTILMQRHGLDRR